MRTHVRMQDGGSHPGGWSRRSERRGSSDADAPLDWIATRKENPALQPSSEKGEGHMAWTIEGRYFENCSCEVVCPCTASLALGADNDYCRFALVFHVDSGVIE